LKKPVLILILAVVALSAATFFWISRNPGKTAGPGTHTGTVEAQEVAVSFRIPGHVESVLFEEGDYLSEGQILAVLDTASLSLETGRARAALNVARSRLATARAKATYIKKTVQAQINAAEANLDKLESGLRPQEVEAARQGVEKARAEAANAQAGAQRARNLFAKGVIPLTRLEDAQTAEQVSHAALQSARENLDIAETGTRAEDIRAAEATLGMARARREEVQAAVLEAQSLENEIKVLESELGLALTRLEHATLRAPLSGVAMTKSVEQGENVSAAHPVTTIADLSQIKVRFYVPEDGLGTLNLGDRITVLSDASPGEQFEGRISFISEQAEFTPKNIQTKEERTKLVYMIKGLAPNPDRKLKPGMPVDVILGD